MEKKKIKIANEYHMCPTHYDINKTLSQLSVLGRTKRMPYELKNNNKSRIQLKSRKTIKFNTITGYVLRKDIDTNASMTILSTAVITLQLACY